MDEFEVQDIIDYFYKISDCIYIQNIAILEDTIHCCPVKVPDDYYKV